VLVVLDYTGMGTMAETEVRALIEPVLEQLDWESNAAVRELLRETSPVLWEEELDKAIARLRADAAPILLNSALDKHDAALASPQEAILAQREVNKASQDTIAKEKTALDKESDRLQNLRVGTTLGSLTTLLSSTNQIRDSQRKMAQDVEDLGS
jgi:hypothetical protein